MMTATDKLFGTTTLTERQAALAKKTYGLLSLSILAAVGGGYLGATTPGVIKFFGSIIGVITAMILINVIPRLALRAAKAHKGLALLALLADGFFSGFVLAPLVAFAARKHPGALTSAGVVTGIIFLAVTAYVMSTRRRFHAPFGLLWGVFCGITGAIFLNLFLHLTVLGFLISIAIGVLGVFMLVYATSDVLNNPDFDDEIGGALMLFSALFNIFVSILNIILRCCGISETK